MTQEEFNNCLETDKSLVKCSNERLAKKLGLEIVQVDNYRKKRLISKFVKNNIIDETCELLESLKEVDLEEKSEEMFEQVNSDNSDKYERYGFEKNSKGEIVRERFRLKKINAEDKNIDWSKLFEQSLNNIFDSAYKIPKLVAKEGRKILLINATDVHLNKKSYTENLTLEQQLKELEEYIITAVLKAQQKCKDFKIVLHIGDDLINSEWNNATTKGTPQDCLESSEIVFSKTLKTLSALIRELAKHFEIEIVCVNGNHAYYLEITLFEALKQIMEAYGVAVNYSRNLRFYHKVDNIAFMFVHKKCNVGELPLKFNTESPEMYSSKYKYIITADEHSKMKTHFVTAKESHGIEHIMCTSISTTDKWHHDSGYIGNHKRMLCIIFDEDGIESEFYVRDFDLKMLENK